MGFGETYIRDFMVSKRGSKSTESKVSRMIKPSLINWGPVTHICISKLTIIGPDNGLLPGRRQAITRSNAIMYKKNILPECFRARGGNWSTALYKSSSRSPSNVLLTKTVMFEVARHMGPSIGMTCRVIATKEGKSINWNLSQYQKTGWPFQEFPL